jgi:isovaleryl-CoA dehydrogenase
MKWSSAFIQGVIAMIVVKYLSRLGQHTSSQIYQWSYSFSSQGKLADMYARTVACRALVMATAAAADAGRPDRKDCAAAILFAAENATQVALDAIQVLGGNGYVNEYPTGRLLRDAKLYEIGAGTSEIRRFLIGRELAKECVEGRLAW